MSTSRWSPTSLLPSSSSNPAQCPRSFRPRPTVYHRPKHLCNNSNIVHSDAQPNRPSAILFLRQGKKRMGLWVHALGRAMAEEKVGSRASLNQVPGMIFSPSSNTFSVLLTLSQYSTANHLRRLSTVGRGPGPSRHRQIHRHCLGQTRFHIPFGDNGRCNPLDCICHD